MNNEKKATAQALVKQGNNKLPQSDAEVAKIIKEATAQAKKDRVDRFRKRFKATAPAPRYESKSTGKDAVTLEMSASIDAVTDICGTANPAFAEHLTSELTSAICHSSKPSELGVANAGLAALAGIAPTDETEAMLAAQMVATHQAAMKMVGRAVRATELNSAQWQSGFAIKLLRTYTMQMEALQRYRGKGQKMTVEHVHVYAGGQAIVGTVEQGGGVKLKTEDQPHAKQISHEQTTYAPMSAMPCEDKERQPLPVPRDA
ncbi:MAG: hypothetical protein PHD48_06330 [Alphaproteobacteria bacterium]|nr:hypothetical protein [Alphaproteobacteria bacterium]